MSMVYTSSKITVGRVCWDGDQGFAVAADAAPPIFIRTLESTLRAVLHMLDMDSTDLLVWEGCGPEPRGDDRPEIPGQEAA